MITIKQLEGFVPKNMTVSVASQLVGFNVEHAETLMQQKRFDILAMLNGLNRPIRLLDFQKHITNQHVDGINVNSIDTLRFLGYLVIEQVSAYT